MASVDGLMEPASGSAGFAIVGYAARFPGAADVDEFWRVLAEGRDAVQRQPDDGGERVEDHQRGQRHARRDEQPGRGGAPRRDAPGCVRQFPLRAWLPAAAAIFSAGAGCALPR